MKSQDDIFRSVFYPLLFRIALWLWFLDVMVIPANFGIGFLIKCSISSLFLSMFLRKSFTSAVRSLAFTVSRFASRIHNLSSSAFTHINIRFVFRPTKRLSHFFPVKDRLPKRLRSHMLYSFTCQWCHGLHERQTARHLHTRASDHLGVSPLTGKITC